MKRTFITSFFLIGFAVTGFSQSNNLNNADFKAKVNRDVEEVYKGYPQYMTPSHILRYEAKEERVEVKHQSISNTEHYPVLSSVIMKNKYNTALVRDYAYNFDPLKFNPLKYSFDYSSKVDKVYRVDDADYIIIIHPAD